MKEFIVLTEKKKG